MIVLIGLCLGIPVLALVVTAIGLLASLCSDGKHEYTPTTSLPDIQANIPERPQTEYPDIADQLDGRLTNVFKDPMKGIL